MEVKCYFEMSGFLQLHIIKNPEELELIMVYPSVPQNFHPHTLYKKYKCPQGKQNRRKEVILQMYMHFPNTLFILSNI
jgi:hypothetical protein